MTMIKTTGLRRANRDIREAMEQEIADHGSASPAYLLRRDGGTDVYTCVMGQIVRTRTAGHVTGGMVVTDLPCIVS